MEYGNAIRFHTNDVVNSVLGEINWDRENFPLYYIPP